ncbi:hypothetical protein FsymDg_1275 [Candidatus Protofrankia datiscae]|uniref:Uncharacterized protein n=1 Tax=Candidatus Protofrankia datiscae TaxID=2716812 RepID=F8B0D4_9ACTN|nr:hypothetical protein FsymDg_1275 [Candidatus Protofrankia datiscae]
MVSRQLCPFCRTPGGAHTEECWFSPVCPDCGAGVGLAHEEGCDQAQCLRTGGQRLMCAFGADHDGDCGRDVWTGFFWGVAECVEFGWWVQDRGDEGLGFVPCAPNAPGAIPNTSRLVLDAVWDPAAGRWQLRDTRPQRDDHRPDPTPPAQDDEDDEEHAVGGDETPPGTELIEAPRIDSTPADGDETFGEMPTETRMRAARRLWDVAIGELPSVWSEPPAEPAALVRYARDGDWCAPEATGWRRAGQVYCALVAIPVSVVLYVAAWLVQRPGRLAAAAALATIVWIVL